MQEELTKLKRITQGKIGDLEDAAAVADSVRRKQLGDLNGQFDDVQDAFSTLEARISDVGDVAVRIGTFQWIILLIFIGEQMEMLENQRARATEARDLILYYLDFSQGDGTLLDQLRQQGMDGEFKAAQTARRLQALANELDTPGTEVAKQKIAEYCQNLETSLLTSFDQAYRIGDIATMAACSKNLYEFNGGASCAQAYVNQHEFFIDKYVFSWFA